SALTTRSLLPSLLKSPAATARGAPPRYKGWRLEGAIAVAQPDVQSPECAVLVIAIHGRGQVQTAVVVEVGDREGRPLEGVVGGAGRVNGGAKTTRTVAEQHADRVEAGVGRGQVEPAVVVKVGRHQRLGARADGEAHGGAEAGREAVFQAFKAWPMRRGPKRASLPVMAAASVRRQGGSQDLQPTVE